MIEAFVIGPLIGSGRVADVHAFGPHVIKLYKPGRPKADAFSEAAILALLEGHGLPAPCAHAVGDYGGRWGLVMDRAEGLTLADHALADPSHIGGSLNEMVRLQRLLHATSETRLRPLKSRLAANIGRAPQLAPADRRHLLATLSGLPDGDRLCHGDFHPYNVIGEPGSAVIIDWMDATSGPPAADVCRSYLLLGSGAPDLAELYLTACCAGAGSERDSVLAWLPVTAAARLCEDVPEEHEALLALARGG